MEGLIVMALIGVVIIGVIIFQFCQKRAKKRAIGRHRQQHLV